MPEELAPASPDTYIQRRNIVFVEAEEDADGMAAHYECECRFIGKSEYEMLSSIEEIDGNRAVDAYTMQLIEEGVL